MGKKVRSVPAEGFKKATELIGALGRVAEFCEQNDPADVAAGVLPEEIAKLAGHAKIVDAWLSLFLAQISAESS